MTNSRTFLPMLTLLGMTALAPLAAQEQQPGVSPEAEGQQETSQPAAPSASPESGLTLTGEVIAMDQQALRVRTATGVENVILTDRTDKAADVAVGDQVRVDFTRSSQGVMIATQVRELTGAEAGATGQPMSGSEVMGHAAQDTSGATTPPQGQPLDQTGSPAGQSGTTGSTTDTMGSAGSTGSTTGSGSTYDSTAGSTATGSTGSASSYDDQSASATAESSAAGMESDTATADSLPATGSGLPLAGLAGLLALGLALVVRSLR